MHSKLDVACFSFCPLMSETIKDPLIKCNIKPNPLMFLHYSDKEQFESMPRATQQLLIMFRISDKSTIYSRLYIFIHELCDINGIINLSVQSADALVTTPGNVHEEISSLSDANSDEADSTKFSFYSMLFCRKPSYQAALCLERRRRWEQGKILI